LFGGGLLLKNEVDVVAHLCFEPPQLLRGLVQPLMYQQRQQRHKQHQLPDKYCDWRDMRITAMMTILCFLGGLERVHHSQHPGGWSSLRVPTMTETAAQQLSKWKLWMLRMHMLVLVLRPRFVVLQLLPLLTDLLTPAQRMDGVLNIAVLMVEESIRMRVMPTIGCLHHHHIKRMTQVQTSLPLCVGHLLLPWDLVVLLLPLLLPCQPCQISLLITPPVMLNLKTAKLLEAPTLKLVNAHL
jgi:hypothetical protein